MAICKTWERYLEDIWICSNFNILLMIFQKGRKKQSFNEMCGVRDLLTTVRMGKIYGTLSNEFYNGQEIRFSSNFGLILLEKVIYKLSFLVIL